MSRFLRLCSSLLDAFCVETWIWRGHSAVLLLALVPDDRIPSSKGLSSSDAVLSSSSSCLTSPTVPLSCYLSHCCLTEEKKKRHLRDLPNFPRYTSHKFLFKIQKPGGMHLEKAFHTQAKGKSLFCLSSPTGSKEHFCLSFCRFKADLSVLIAFFQLHMGNRETEKNQTGFITKTYGYYLGVKF